MNEQERDFSTIDLEDIIREFGGSEMPREPEEPISEEPAVPESVNIPREEEPATPEEDSPSPAAEEAPVEAAPAEEAEPEVPAVSDDEEDAEDDEDEEYGEEDNEYDDEDEDEDDEDEEDEPAEEPSAPKKNKFSLFGALKKLLDDEEDEEDDEDEDEEDEDEEEAEEAPSVTQAPPQPAPRKSVTSDTIRLDDISQVAAAQTAPALDMTMRLDSLDQVEIPKNPQAGDSDFDDEDEEEVEFIAPPPIIFRARTRLSELRRQLVAGPEKRYYELTEIGVGKLQIAMLLCLVVVLLSAGAAALYAVGKIPENRMRLLVFSQILAMLFGGLLGSGQMIDGIADLFRGKFTLNTLMTFTFAACCVDGVFCLKELRVPICAAFTLEVFMSLWSAYHKRVTEMGQMDSLRKAVRLDSVVKMDDYYNGKPGFLRGEGEVDDFMTHYNETTNPEKHQNRYALFCLLASIGIAAVAGALHDLSLAFQILTTTLLAAVPASFFIALTRPMAVLERKLHALGTVLCGWSGVKGLCGKAAFALNDSDLFPAGSVKMNGVKFYGDRNPDETVAYATALMCANGGTLAPIFEQLLASRNGLCYEAYNLQHYGNGGIGGEVCDEPVLMGTLDFLKSMGVEIPEGTQVKQAVYVSIDGELSGLFAITYSRMKYSASGISTLCGYRGITPVVIAEDFMLTDGFLKEKFGVSTRRMAFPEREARAALAATELAPEAVALALTTQEGLAPAAYAVTGARALRTASRLGLVIHITGGALGLLIMLALAIVGSTELLTPIHVLLYQLVWMIPGLLVTMWTRTI